MRYLQIPLLQHVGKPCQTVVKPGDEVIKGQLIAEPAGLGSKIHASASGKIVEVNETAIFLEPFSEQPIKPLLIKETSDILEAIYEAGIVGAGGAGFPTHVKMKINLSGGVVIANGVECEPFLSHNVKQMEETPHVIIRGLRYAMKVTGAAKGYVAIKAKNTGAIAAITDAIRDAPDLEIKLLPDMYPMGEERAIIREVLGKLLAPNELPSVAGAAISNVETLSNITRAVEDRLPVITKNITVAGKLAGGRESKIFMDVPIGTPVSELLSECGGIEEPHGEIIIGGPFMGKSGTPETPVVKTSGGVLVTIPFPQESRPIGLLVCGCGATEARLREIAGNIGAPVAAVQRCKQVVDMKNGAIKCEKPGDCPGQAERILDLRKKGAQVLLVGTCSDCTNTCMGIAPKLKIPIYHHTDHVMRTIGKKLVRRL
ncbi:MAG: proline reductase-associated electron transfer protein PrdC [Dethiobacteria bacterium]|jgi:electron transport complex protein RnfC